MKDLLIIGGSAAACAGAIYAARRQLDFQMVSEDAGGEVATSGEIENWLGLKHTTGIELAAAFEAHVKSYKIPWDLGYKVTKIDKQNSGFKTTASFGDKEKVYESRAVILATGAPPRELGAPGEKEFRGRGVTYCTVCDGPLFGGKVVATIGGGNSALESALMMAGLATKVYLINKNPGLKGEQVLINKIKAAPNVEIIANAQTQEFFVDQFLTGLKYKDPARGEVKTLALQGAFVHIGMVPNSQMAPAEVIKNSVGEIEVNAAGETNVLGFLAAGDVTNTPYKQIAVAAGQGVTAALSAVSYLNKN